MLERARRNRNRIAATAALAFIAMGGSASANTGGATFDKNSPAPVVTQLDSAGACPKVEKITSKTTLSTKCRGFLMNTLRKSVYDDSTDLLAVATYQKVFNSGVNTRKKLAVDGLIGVNTASAILYGNALKVSSPDPSHSHKKEFLIRKSDQTGFLINHGKVEHAISVSTGREKHYDEIGPNGTPKSGPAHTPTGTFKVMTEESANYTNSYGDSMPNAQYLNYPDIAIHTGSVAPTGHQSHGCGRVEDGTMVNLVDPWLEIGSRVVIIK